MGEYLSSVTSALVSFQVLWGSFFPSLPVGELIVISLWEVFRACGLSHALPFGLVATRKCARIPALLFGLVAPRTHGSRSSFPGGFVRVYKFRVLDCRFARCLISATHITLLLASGLCDSFGGAFGTRPVAFFAALLPVGELITISLWEVYFGLAATTTRCTHCPCGLVRPTAPSLALGPQKSVVEAQPCGFPCERVYDRASLARVHVHIDASACGYLSPGQCFLSLWEGSEVSGLLLPCFLWAWPLVGDFLRAYSALYAFSVALYFAYLGLYSR
jgi:hypothetical protein